LPIFYGLKHFIALQAVEADFIICFPSSFIITMLFLAFLMYEIVLDSNKLAPLIKTQAQQSHRRQRDS